MLKQHVFHKVGLPPRNFSYHHVASPYQHFQLHCTARGFILAGELKISKNRCQSCSPPPQKMEMKRYFLLARSEINCSPGSGWRNCFSTSKRLRSVLVAESPTPSLFREVFHFYPEHSHAPHTHTTGQQTTSSRLNEIFKPLNEAEPKSKMGQFFVVYGFDNYVSVQD